MSAVLETVNTPILKLTEKAQAHFALLIQKEDLPGLNIRMSVIHPNTLQAEVGITFCPSGEEEPDDLALPFPAFILYIELTSVSALQNANIDFQEDKLGGQLSIKAPFLKGWAPSDQAPLIDRVEYVLEHEINPSLASHGGKVSLVEIVEPGIIVLKFGGGCQGCGMVSMTLKHGIEGKLKELFPEITEIRDVTDHEAGEAPYCS